MIISPLGTPWITQASWNEVGPREAAHLRRGRDRDRERARRSRRQRKV
jgi:hypothetical protein